MEEENGRKKETPINSATLGQRDCLPHLLANFMKYGSNVFSLPIGGTSNSSVG